MAAAPSAASSTSYPARSNAFRSIARSSFLSSTRRRGSISLVSTMNLAVVRELQETSVQRREAADFHDQRTHYLVCPTKQGAVLPPSPKFWNGRIFPKTYNSQFHFDYRAHPGSPPDFLSSASMSSSPCFS